MKPAWLEDQIKEDALVAAKAAKAARAAAAADAEAEANSLVELFRRLDAEWFSPDHIAEILRREFPSANSSHIDGLVASCVREDPIDKWIAENNPPARIAEIMREPLFCGTTEEKAKYAINKYNCELGYKYYKEVVCQKWHAESNLAKAGFIRVIGGDYAGVGRTVEYINQPLSSVKNAHTKLIEIEGD
jgi:hypothetical protein